MKMLLRTILSSALVAHAAQAQGTLYLSNLDATTTGSTGVANDSWAAQLFATGNEADGYVLNSIELLMTDASGSPDGFGISLYNSGGRSPGSTELEKLSGSASPTTAGVFTYTSAGTILAPSTGYWIIATANADSTIGSFNWSSSTGGLASQNGWFVNVGAVSSTSGATWNLTSPFQFAIYASPIPEPASVTLLIFGSLAMVVHRRRMKSMF